MFWLFGHPEVYILILPAMGIVSEILPTFSRKPLFGYAVRRVLRASRSASWAGACGRTTCSRSASGPVANSAFALSTMFIAVPTGVKIFNWIGDDVGRQDPLHDADAVLDRLRDDVHHRRAVRCARTRSCPTDYQQTDTYYIVAHFHYVLFGGAIFGLFARDLLLVAEDHREAARRAPRQAALLADAHRLQPDVRADAHPRSAGHAAALLHATRRARAATSGTWSRRSARSSSRCRCSMFIINVARHAKRGKPSGDDPWDARTLEWTIPSPPPHYNFDEIPVVKERDDFWHQKYAEDESGMAGPGRRRRRRTPRQMPRRTHDEHAEPHMPKPSYWPLVAAAGLPLIGYGLMFQWVARRRSACVVLLVGIYGWALEPVE